MSTTRHCAGAQAGFASGDLASKGSALSSHHLPAAGRIAGVLITLPKRCRCGGNLAQVDLKALHLFALSCRSCDRPRGFLERAAASFITEIINRFGVPTQPIMLRQHDNMREGSPPAAPLPSLAVEQRS
jgi:hypothetical protein